MEILLSGNVLAFYPQKTVLSGSTDNLAQTLKSIDQYTPIISEVAKEDKIAQSFIDKPEIAKTKTREEMDQEKKKEEQKKLAQQSRNVVYRDNPRPTQTKPTEVVKNSDRSSNGYMYGFCTWYAAEKRSDIPNQWGNAGNWLNSAQANGWPTGSNPQAGAVIVTRESWAGHVGYVEKVEGDTVTISEMNFSGWGKVNTRTLNVNDPVIKGYVY